MKKNEVKLAILALAAGFDMRDPKEILTPSDVSYILRESAKAL